MRIRGNEAPSLVFLFSVAIAPACSGALDGEGPFGDGDGDGGADGGGGGEDGGSGGGGPDAAPIAPLTVCASGGDHDTVQGGVDAAEDGQRVEVCAGTYREHLVITAPVEVVGIDGAEQTIIDATATGTGVVVRGVGGGTAALRGLTIRNGSGGQRGGGLRCSDSALAIDDVAIVASAAGSGAGLAADACDLAIAGSRFTGNLATASGGGIYLVSSSGLLEDSLVADNSAHRGGGVLQLEGSVALIGNDIRDNTAADGGGGVYHQSNAPLTGNRIAGNRAARRGGGLSLVEHAAIATGNTITGNRSGDDGAGLFVFLSRATVSNSDISDNHADGDAGGLRVLGSQATITGNRVHGNSAIGDGGGMKISHNRSVVQDNSFVDNTAAGLGGGIELDDDHSTLSRLVITGNRAWAGGGLHCNEIGVDFRVENTLIAGNTATGTGGAVRYDDVRSTGTFSFVTMANNSSPGVGGADFAAGSARVDNSIIAGNEGVQVRFEGGAVAGWRYTDVSPAVVAGMSDPTGAAGNISQPPEFVDPAAGNYRLRSGSPCRNAGDPALADPDGTRADMGAYGGPGAL